MQVEPLRARRVGLFAGHEAGEVGGEVGLQRRVPEQVRHDQALVGVALELQDDAHLVGRLVRDVDEGRQLAGENDLGDPLHDLRLVGAVGDARHVHRPRAARHRPGLPGRAHADGAAAGPVDLPQLLRRVEDLPAGGEVGARDVLAEGRAVEPRVCQQLQERGAHLADVVRRNVGRHADRDAGGAVDQQVGQPRGQDDRLLPGAVVVRPQRHRALVQLGQQLGAGRVEPALRVAHRGGAVAVERAEVAEPFDQRVAHRERLGHAHQRVVDGRVSVRVVAAHHVADHLRALARLGVGGEALLPHRVQDAALDRLEAVADVGQRPRRDDRQRVVEVPRLGGFVEGDGRVAPRGGRSGVVVAPGRRSGGAGLGGVQQRRLALRAAA